MAITVEVVKDSFGQDIIEGKMCIVHAGKSAYDVGYIVETRKQIKVRRLCKDRNGVDVFYDNWWNSLDVLMFNEDNIFNIMDGTLLHKMASLRANVAEEAAKMLAKKEKKRERLAKKDSSSTS